MPTTHYCWRCRIDVPMLNEAEWTQLASLLTEMTSRIQEHREATGSSLAVALKLGFEQPALNKYFELTGVRETNVDALWHRRLENYGPPCSCCGKLLRTKRARRCVECGHAVASHH